MISLHSLYLFHFLLIIFIGIRHLKVKKWATKLYKIKLLCRLWGLSPRFSTTSKIFINEATQTQCWLSIRKASKHSLAQLLLKSCSSLTNIRKRSKIWLSKTNFSNSKNTLSKRQTPKVEVPEVINLRELPVPIKCSKIWIWCRQPRVVCSTPALRIF